MKRAGKYLRISDDREGRELGVERQDEDCDKLAEREGVEVVGRYVDNDLSASARARKRRPDFERMLADVKAGRLDMIIAYTSSRLTRRQREHEDLIDLAVDYGVTYRFVRSPDFDLNTAAGRRIARILAANDQGEAEDIAERVTREVRHRAERGEYHGGPRAYGYTATDDGRIIVVEHEADEIRSWYERVLAGGSLAGIRADLERRGVPSISGKPWRAPVIRKILLHPRNIGLRILEDGSEHPAPHPAIVPVETWRAVKSILEDSERRTNHVGTARRHLGTGLYRCERCAPRTVNTNYAPGRQLVYKCLTCWRSWRAAPLDEWVDAVVAGVLAAEDARERLLPAPTADVDTRALVAESTAIRETMTADAAEFFLGAKGATKAALQDALRRAEQRLAEIEAQLADAGRGDPLAPLLNAADPVQAWRDVDDVAQRQAIVSALMTIELGAPIRGRARWDAARFVTVTPKSPRRPARRPARRTGQD